MTELHVLDVVRNGAEAFRFLHHLVRRDEDELGILVDEFLDQPGASNPINLDPFARDPLHRPPPIIFRPRFKLTLARSSPLGPSIENTGWVLPERRETGDV